MPSRFDFLATDGPMIVTISPSRIVRSIRRRTYVVVGPAWYARSRLASRITASPCRSFAPERDRGVHRGRAPGRQVTGGEGNQREHHRDPAERQRIVRAHLVEQAPQKPREEQRARQADENARADE